jgi:hypothetical protein
MVTVPTAGGMKLDIDVPLVGVTGEAGVNRLAPSPLAPLARKVTGLEAVVTLFPLASWMVAV